MKKIIIFIGLIMSLMFGRQIYFETNDAISVKAAHSNVKNNDLNQNSSTSREEIIIQEWNFEDELWNNDSGWGLTEASYNSASHSYLSPNTAATQNSSWNLVSNVVSLPELGEDEIMRFKFWLWGDMPDTDGDADDYLDDYYQLSIMDLEALAWHASNNAPEADGAAYWCADEAVGPDGGYLDEWMQYIDTAPVLVDNTSSLSASLKFELEDEAGAEGAISGSCTDGWDAANVRISSDGGSSWDLLVDDLYEYDFACGYGWIYNDPDYEDREPLSHLAPGWGGSSNGWFNFTADLSAYEGLEVIVRFAFGSDPSYSTLDQTDMTGFQVDNIVISNDSNVLYSDNCDDSSNALTMTPSGEVWEGQFYDYCDDTRPGGLGWEEYTPGLAFNGNALHDISHLAGKDVLIKFSSRYDDNDDGGVGQGLFIDDFTIYKESSGSYPSPTNLVATSGDEYVDLAWSNMNNSGVDQDFIYDNGVFDNGISMVSETSVGFAGASFQFGASSTVNSVDVYHLADDGYCSDTDYSSETECVNSGAEWIISDQVDFDMDICIYGTVGSLFSTESTYPCISVNTSTFSDGWNTIDLFNVDGWVMSGSYIIAHSFNSGYAAALDETSSGDNSYFSYLQNNGSTASWQGDLSGDGSFEGEWGIRANISYESANVTYNVYRDDTIIQSMLSVNNFSDLNVINDTEYTYAVTATYLDGEESSYSNSVNARPESSSNHEEYYDDGTAEEGFDSGGYGSENAVLFNAIEGGEIVKRFKWYSMDDGGAFKIQIWEDDNGEPGTELYSAAQIENSIGWNEENINEEIIVSGNFWIGTKNYSSTQDIGIDTDSEFNFGMYKSGSTADWTDGPGTQMFRVVLDCGDNCPGDDPCQDTISGDTNGDGGINVLDVVTLVGYILGNSQLEDCGLIAADYNNDGTVNVLDVVSLVGTILGGRIADATSAFIDISVEGVSITADGYIGAIELTLSHGLGFSLSLTDKALVADYNTDGTTTKLIVVAPEDTQIFTTSDNFIVDEVLVTNSESFIEVTEIVAEFGLSAAYPNPFNPSTTLDFSTIEAGYASVKVYNLMGQVVGVLLDGIVEPNTYSLTWDANNFSSGVYMIKAESASQVSTQKIMLLK